MKKSYYFLIGSLPPLTWQQEVPYTLLQFYQWIFPHLTFQDGQALQTMQTLWDLQNLQCLWQKRPLLPLSPYSQEELLSRLENEEGFPEYVFDFCQRHKTARERNEHFFTLLFTYFQCEIPKATGFVSDYLLFQRDSRLTFLGLRAKKRSFPLDPLLATEDPHDPVIADLLMQKEHHTYVPLPEYQPLKELFSSFFSDPIAFHAEWLSTCFTFFSEKIREASFFSFDRIACYLAQLFLLLEYSRSSDEEGDLQAMLSQPGVL